MSAYYNEIDPYAAQWLRNLIAAGHIAAGDVDERSITEVQPDDLRGYSQCHFFAGIGGWSLGLRMAGWPDDRPVWTGSCPCQPFSAAGKQRGSDDERHLWPAFFRLIAECRPGSVFGEQVAGAAGLAWLDHVCADLEGAGYAAAAANLGAHSVGAPHIRQRLYWVANASGARAWGHAGTASAAQAGRSSARGSDGIGRRDSPVIGGAVRALADLQEFGRREGRADASRRDEGTEPQGAGLGPSDDCGGSMANAADVRSVAAEVGGGFGPQQSEGRVLEPTRACDADPWASFEWIECSDGKARPTQPGLFPLAHGVSGRVGRLRAYGNAIVPQVAAAFIEAAA